MKLIATLIVASLTFASIENAQAQSVKPVQAAATTSSPQSCGRPGKNGGAACLQQLRKELTFYCELRTSAKARFGAGFGELPELKQTQEICDGSHNRDR